MNNKAKYSLLVIVGLLFVSQLFRPERISTDKKIDSDISNHLTVSSHVGELLEKSCYDCHSMNTVWPWYSNFAPVSWMIAYDVKKGRERVDFSGWTDYNTMNQIGKLSMIQEAVKSGEMPLKHYTMMHKESKLTPENIEEICKWAEEQINLLQIK